MRKYFVHTETFGIFHMSKLQRHHKSERGAHMTGDDFARKVTELTPVMYRVCYMQLSSTADRDDAVQDAIFKAWQKRHTLRNEEFFKTWLIRILINVCHDMQKSQKRCQPVETVPEPAHHNNSRIEELRDALMTIDEKLRMPVLLHYIDGYSIREVSRMLCVTENAVKLRLLRGRRKLREQLSEEVFDE